MTQEPSSDVLVSVMKENNIAANPATRESYDNELNLETKVRLGALTHLRLRIEEAMTACT